MCHHIFSRLLSLWAFVLTSISPYSRVMCLARLLDSLGDQSLPCFVLTRLTVGFMLGSPFVQWDQQISVQVCRRLLAAAEVKIPNACARRCCMACGLSTVVWRPSNQHTTFALDLAEVGCVSDALLIAPDRVCSNSILTSRIRTLSGGCVDLRVVGFDRTHRNWLG